MVDIHIYLYIYREGQIGLKKQTRDYIDTNR